MCSTFATRQVGDNVVAVVDLEMWMALSGERLLSSSWLCRRIIIVVVGFGGVFGEDLVLDGTEHVQVET